MERKQSCQRGFCGSCSCFMKYFSNKKWFSVFFRQTAHNHFGTHNNGRPNTLLWAFSRSVLNSIRDRDHRVEPETFWRKMLQQLSWKCWIGSDCLFVCLFAGRFGCAHEACRSWKESEKVKIKTADFKL